MQSRIAKSIKGLLGHAAGAAGVFRREFRSKMVIVAFHRVRDDFPEDGLTVGSAKFVRFCEFFRSQFDVVPLAQQVAGCSAAEDMGGTLSITFDDGYRDNFEVAAPLLRSLGLPATFFVTTGFIGSQAIAPWDRALPRAPGWMDWDQLRVLVSQGFEIGCHTDTHIDLAAVDAATARAELRVSRDKLRDQLGSSARLFAYPFGGRNNISAPAVELVREAGFACCAACFGGVNGSTESPFDLKRVVIGQGFVTPNQFGFDLLAGRV